ncbi:MAG: phage scaffolding protein [Prevotella sp.]|nr:phage scaffolding protein [Candidatus Prevotella equi]
MKTDELKEKGLTEEQIAFVMAENGKDIGKVQKKLDDMTAERDKEATRATTAEETLKKFEGVDVEAIKKDLADWKTKAEKAESDYAAKIAERDFDDMIKDAISSANGLNAKAIKALLDTDALKASKNQKEDVAAAIKALSEAEDSKMLFKQPEAKAPAKFTSTSTGSATGGNVTKESIMAIKDRGERLQAISQHKDLFQ